MTPLGSYDVAVSALLALIAAACGGTSDFVGGVASRRAPALVITFYGQIVGLFFGLALAVVLPGEFILGDVGWGLLGGIGSALGLLSLYAGYAAAQVGIAAPVAGVGTAAFPVIVDVATGASLTNRVAIGIGLGLIAIAFISLSRSDSSGSVRASLLYGLGGALGLGSLLICLGQTSEEGALWSIGPTRVSGFAVIAAVMLIRKTSFALPLGTFKYIAAIGVIGTMANALFVIAADLGSVSTAAVLLSMFPAATVLWARIIFRERMRRIQVIGIALALIAVALIVAG